MRVAYTLEQCWHRVPGGTAVAAIEAARALAGESGRGADSAGPQINIDLIGVAARHRGPPRPPYRPPIEVRHLPLPRPALYEAWHRLRRPPVQRATGAVDVVHATTFAIPPKSAALVVTIHDLAFDSYPEYFTRRGLRFFRRGMALARADADLVLCPSQATRDHCLRVGFTPERIEVIPHGISATPAGPEDVARARERYGLGDRYILFSGTIEPRKNLRGLLEAFRQLDTDADLVVAGPKGWNEDLAPWVNGLGGRVRTLGFVPPELLGPLYAGAAAVCAPSFLEGFGFPVLEAMAQGAPVVTSRGTSTEEIAGDAAVLIDPHRPESIAQALARVLEDEDLATSLRAKGLRRAASYSWSRTAKLMARAYARVGP